MSKNKDSDSEVDIYEDLPNFSSDNTISELENAKKNLENELKALRLKLKEIEIDHNKLKKENEALSLNISSLYKTAACEIKRKDQMIQELRKEKDSILFRRHRNENQKHSRRHNAQPEVHVIDDYQPSIDNEVCIIEENRQQDYTSYQHAEDVQYDENYGEDEVIATFPEEDEDDHTIQNTPQEVPNTIFSRRKAQQLKMLMKKSDNLQDSTRKDVRSEDPEIIIEDSSKTRSTIFDRRKNQTLKSCNKRHDISKTIVEIDIASSPALDDHAFNVKKKSSTITSGTKNIDLSHKKTELSASKHSNTVRKTVEANVKTLSKVNELPSTSVKALVEIDTACSPALDNHAFRVKEKSSTITSGTKNIDLSHKKTELSASKHLDTVRKAVEANVKTSSKVNELPSASVKATQSSRTENVKVSRSKSYHKPKEHSDVDKSHREKHSHVTSKDKRSGSDTHSHRKSSSSSRSKFSTHSSSHRRSTKSSFSPSSPKGRSIRETSVSRALKSLRSKSQLKDLDYKSSRSLKERDRHAEVDNEGSRKGESQEHKKTDRTIVRSQTSSKLIPEKRQPKITPLPDKQLVTENVCLKSKLAPNTAKTMVIGDSKASTSINEDIRMKTKSCSEKEYSLQQECLAKSSEKEEYSTQTDNAKIGDNVSCGERIMQVQTDKMSHKEESNKTLMVSSTPSEDLTEVQEGSNETRTDTKMLGSEVSTNGGKLHKEAINKTPHISQEDSISKVSQHSGSSENKNISETAVDNDLPPKKQIGEMSAANRKVTEDVQTNDDEQHKESVIERFTGGDVLCNKDVNEEATDVDSMHNEDIIKDSLVSAKRSNTASDDGNVTLKTTLPNLISEVGTADSVLKSKISTNNTPTELTTQDENAKPTRESAEALQDSVTNQVEVTAPENSDLSSNMHTEENSILSASHEKKKQYKSSHLEDLQNAAIKDSNEHCTIETSKNFVEVEPLERPIDASENVQVISSTLQTDVEERNTTLGISEEQSVSEERRVHSLLNKRDSNPALQELVSESLAVEKEHIKSVNHSLPNPDESLSPTSTFKKGNISFTVMNEPGCFRRRKFKRISSANLNNTDASNDIAKAADEHLHSEKLRGTKRPYERLDTESSVSPPVKKQAFSDPQRDQLYPSTIKDKSKEDSSSVSPPVKKQASADPPRDQLCPSTIKDKSREDSSSISPPVKMQASADPPRDQLHPSTIKDKPKENSSSVSPPVKKQASADPPRDRLHPSTIKDKPKENSSSVSPPVKKQASADPPRDQLHPSTIKDKPKEDSSSVSPPVKKQASADPPRGQLYPSTIQDKPKEDSSSVSPPVKKQASADLQRDQLYPSTIKDKPKEDSSQRPLEINSTQTDETAASVTETNMSNDKDDTDLEEGEIEDSDNDEKTSEGNKKLNKDMQETKVLKSVIHTDCNIRKEQSRKYLELDRKARENRKKPHGSHLQDVGRRNRDKQHHLPKKLFSHCKRRSPSELLIKDRNIKAVIKEKDQNSRSRSTSSETPRNTNEKLKARYRTKENKVDTKRNCVREEKKKTKDKAKTSSTNKSALQSVQVNKPKDLSAWTRLGNLSSNEGGDAQSSRKENNVAQNEDNRDSFKIPEISNQTVRPVTKYIIKRRKVCNLQDNVSVPVVNISPPKPIATDESFKSVHVKTVAASNTGMQASKVNLIPPRKINFSRHSKETLISKSSTSASRPNAPQTDVNCSGINADNKSLVRSYKTLSSQVSSDSSAFSSSSSSEYENNSDETWNPKRRRKRRVRKNPKTEVTKNKTNEISS